MIQNHDPVFHAFLEAQFLAAQSLSEESDVLDQLVALPPFPAQRWIARFRCRSLAGHSALELRENDVVTVGIHFGSGHLREVNPASLITILDPPDVFAPNVRGPHVCAEWTPGIGLTDIIHTLYEVLTLQTRNTVHGLNPHAMEWALQHQDELPLERRPLRRSRKPQPVVS